MIVRGRMKMDSNSLVDSSSIELQCLQIRSHPGCAVNAQGFAGLVWRRSHDHKSSKPVLELGIISSIKAVSRLTNYFLQNL
jgi:hypothetical protein